MSLQHHPRPKSSIPRDYDHLFKLLIIGDSGVGKSSLLLRFADDSFSINFITTIGVDFKIKTVNIDGKRIKLQIWDTAGQERFRTITATYYRGTHGVIIVYDVNNGETFANVRRWVTEIEQNCESVDCILVGNKNDNPSTKVVLTEDAQRFARKMELELFETSARDNINVDEMFMAIAKKALYSKCEQKVIREKREKEIETISLARRSRSKSNRSEKKKCCH